jgi:gluconolactonase
MTAIEKLWTGGAWLEGPAWLHGQLRFSDIPNNRIMQFDPTSGETSVYAENVEYTNGRTVDAAGNAVQASHGRRAIERDTGGVVTTIVDRWAMGRFNSPNDVIVASDGAIWFTDPPYGIHESGAEGYPGDQEYGGCYVFRFDGVSAAPIITDMVHPNGLALSPDESVLYVAETAGFWHPEIPFTIRAYDTTDWRGRLFVVPEGVADGFRVAPNGELWTSSGNAVAIYSPAGQLLQSIPFPERVSNLCFGGDGYLYVTASTSLYRLPVRLFLT